jgi:acyl-coenzyme A thioesterase PaaI-like protein
MTLTPTGEADGVVGFTAVLTDTWTIGPKAHGGVLMALCASAARTALDVPGAVPVAVSASYLGPPDPGPVELAVTMHKRGRRVSLADVELRQGGRTAVRAVVTLGALEDADPLHLGPDPLAGMPAEPPADLLAVGGHPLGDVVRLAAVCDLVLDPASTAFARGETAADPAIRLWVRPHGEDPDLLFALVAGDVSPPVTLNLGRFGWAPTVSMTAFLRRAPAPGWLRVRAATSVVGGSWFDEDAVVLDSTGAVVAQTRQLAVVPAADQPLPG